MEYEVILSACGGLILILIGLVGYFMSRTMIFMDEQTKVNAQLSENIKLLTYRMDVTDERHQSVSDVHKEIEENIAKIHTRVYLLEKLRGA